MAEFEEQTPVQTEAPTDAAPAAEKQQPFDWRHPLNLPPHLKLQFPRFILGLIAVVTLALLVGTGLVVMNMHNSENPTSDLGEGISTFSGLRGHLTTKWDGKLKYQLRMEAIGPVQHPGFAYVTGNPPQPYSMNIRLLDSTGFALCGKQILFPFDPKQSAGPPPREPNNAGKKGEAERFAAAQAAYNAGMQDAVTAEAAREKGKDMLVNQAGEDGQVMALNAQGELPCTIDMYRRADYWDFNTSFPSTDEQTAIMNKPAADKALRAQEAAERARAAAAQKKAHMFGQVPFYVQGDARVSNFDPGRGVLDAGRGATFVVDKKAQTVAAGWGANAPLIHYKCDQRGSCILTTAGGGGAIHGRLVE